MCVGQPADGLFWHVHTNGRVMYSGANSAGFELLE